MILAVWGVIPTEVQLSGLRISDAAVGAYAVVKGTQANVISPGM
jgi:hypothetical protein